ncbi:PadR family transcriptional regulator [Citricoccus alkalitolerans]|uniref:PadR family transcriptional regulator n=1 Tax=Citricoccus alkalitolerans TaxID=246603 RepID=A0ABV8XU72_9MICC
MADQPRVSATAGTLLGLLTERPMTGWELVAQAKDRVGNFWTIQRSQAYRELGQLEKAGLVIALPQQERRKRPYEITDAGQAAYLDWVRQVPGDESVRIPFLLTVSFADDVPSERFDALLEEQRRRHRERLETYEGHWATLQGTARRDARLATLALGIGYERAALDWLDQLPTYLGRDR